MPTDEIQDAVKTEEYTPEWHTTVNAGDTRNIGEDEILLQSQHSLDEDKRLGSEARRPTGLEYSYRSKVNIS